MDVQQQFLQKKKDEIKAKPLHQDKKFYSQMNVSFSENSNCDKPNMIPFWIASFSVEMS
jgi:hypothetical protein